MRDHVQDIAHNIFETLIIKRQIQDYHGDGLLHRSCAIIAPHQKIDRTRSELRPLEAVRPFTTRCGAAVPLRQVRRVAAEVALPLPLRKRSEARDEGAAALAARRALRAKVH